MERIKRTFTVAPGTLETLKRLLEFGERDHLIENYLLYQYKGPEKSAEQLKSRPKGGTETILIAFTQSAYDKLEMIAEEIGEKVKRSHIFKDMLEQFIFSLSNEQQQRIHEIKNQFKENIQTLQKFLTNDELREEFESYLQKNGVECMTYNSPTETLVSIGSEREEPYQTKQPK